jgi:MraZ protein
MVSTSKELCTSIRFEEFGKLVDQINTMQRLTQQKKCPTLYIGQSMKMEIDKDGHTVMPIHPSARKLG